MNEILDSNRFSWNEIVLYLIVDELMCRVVCASVCVCVCVFGLKLVSIIVAIIGVNVFDSLHWTPLCSDSFAQSSTAQFAIHITFEFNLMS